MDIAISALYLLAAPSTPEEARLEALERASQGEIITHALAKQICFHHTIDVEAEVVKDDEESPAPIQPSTGPKPQSQAEPVHEPLSSTTELEAQPEIPTDVTPLPAELDQAPGKLKSLAQTEPALATDFKVGDRVRIRRQHGEDNWSGETVRIWQITPDGWLRVDVEGHKRVRFTLKPEWVERMPEEASKQFNKQPEPVVPQAGADKPDPESPAPSEQSQGDQLNSLEKRVRTTLTLNGEAVEVEGVITHVRFEWQRGDHSGDVQVPVDQVKFLE